MRDLLHLYQREPALWQVDDSWEGFEWLDANDSENSVISFVRRARNPDELIVVVCNFTPEPRYNYCIPAPRDGYYREILNSDSDAYWGSNLGNLGGARAYAQDWSSTGYAICLTLPPLATVMLKFEAPAPAEPITPPAIGAGEQSAAAAVAPAPAPAPEPEPEV